MTSQDTGGTVEPYQTLDDLSEHRMASLIGDALAEEGISQAEFCRRVGVSPKHLNLVLSGKATARSATLDYWAFTLGRRFVVTLESAQSGRTS
jgi:transcriptional regulator with XRE-family HTH domain